MVSSGLSKRGLVGLERSGSTEAQVSNVPCLADGRVPTNNVAVRIFVLRFSERTESGGLGQVAYCVQVDVSPSDTADFVKCIALESHGGKVYLTRQQVWVKKNARM